MRILLGNPNPVGAAGPTISYAGVNDAQNEDGTYVVGYAAGSDVAAIKEHLFDNPGYVTHLPGNEAVLGITRTFADQSSGKPSWVSVEPQERDPANAEDFERFLSEYWKCDRGIPADLEATHFTIFGPPGTGPAAVDAPAEGA